MSSDRLAFPEESVSIRKSNEDALLKGKFELYGDRVVLKISRRFALSELVRPLPPTFPGTKMSESIVFSRIKSIGVEPKKGVLSRSVRIELQTDDGVTWHIKGPSRIFDVLQDAYQAWKSGGHR